MGSRHHLHLIPLDLVNIDDNCELIGTTFMCSADFDGDGEIEFFVLDDNDAYVIKKNVRIKLACSFGAVRHHVCHICSLLYANDASPPSICICQIDGTITILSLICDQQGVRELVTIFCCHHREASNASAFKATHASHVDAGVLFVTGNNHSVSVFGVTADNRLILLFQRLLSSVVNDLDIFNEFLVVGLQCGDVSLYKITPEVALQNILFVSASSEQATAMPGTGARAFVRSIGVGSEFIVSSGGVVSKCIVSYDDFNSKSHTYSCGIADSVVASYRWSVVSSMTLLTGDEIADEVIRISTFNDSHYHKEISRMRPTSSFNRSLSMTDAVSSDSDNRFESLRTRSRTVSTPRKTDPLESFLTSGNWKTKRVKEEEHCVGNGSSATMHPMCMAVTSFGRVIVVFCDSDEGCGADVFYAYSWNHRVLTEDSLIRDVVCSIVHAPGGSSTSFPVFILSNSGRLDLIPNVAAHDLKAIIKASVLY